MPEPSVCRLCGDSFEQRGRARRTYCKRCSTRADKAIAKRPLVECGECGNKFAGSGRARYCSPACRVDGRRRSDREYMRRYLADPQRRAVFVAQQRARVASRRAKEGRGGEGRRKPRRTRQQAGRAAGRAPRAAAPVQSAECRLCGGSFATYGGTYHAHCKRCAAKADRIVARVRRVKCGMCGKAFATTHSTAKYCSDACRAEAIRRSRKRSRRRLKADPERHAMELARTRAWVASKKDAG